MEGTMGRSRVAQGKTPLWSSASEAGICLGDNGEQRGHSENQNMSRCPVWGWKSMNMSDGLATGARMYQYIGNNRSQISHH